MVARWFPRLPFFPSPLLTTAPTCHPRLTRPEETASSRATVPPDLPGARRPGRDAAAHPLLAHRTRGARRPGTGRSTDRPPRRRGRPGHRTAVAGGVADRRRSGIPGVCCDLREVSFFSAAGVTALVVAHHRATETGSRLTRAARAASPGGSCTSPAWNTCSTSSVPLPRSRPGRRRAQAENRRGRGERPARHLRSTDHPLRLRRLWAGTNGFRLVPQDALAELPATVTATTAAGGHLTKVRLHLAASGRRPPGRAARHRLRQRGRVTHGGVERLLAPEAGDDDAARGPGAGSRRDVRVPG